MNRHRRNRNQEERERGETSPSEMAEGVGFQRGDLPAEMASWGSGGVLKLVGQAGVGLYGTDDGQV
jgi:hypothetical protein